MTTTSRNMAKRGGGEHAWERFAAGVKHKRLKRGSVGIDNGKQHDIGSLILKNQMVIQQLESEPSGKAQKHD